MITVQTGYAAGCEIDLDPAAIISLEEKSNTPSSGCQYWYVEIGLSTGRMVQGKRFDRMEWGSDEYAMRAAHTERLRIQFLKDGAA